MRRDEGEGESDDAGARSIWIRRAGWTLAALIGGPLALLAILVVALQLDPVSTQVARWAVGAASGDSLRLGVDRATGSWLTGLHLEGVDAQGLSGEDTLWSVSVDTATLSYRLLPLVRRRVELGRVRLAGVQGAIRVSSDTAAPPPASEADPWTVTAERVEVGVREVGVWETGSADRPWTLSAARMVVRELAVGEGPMGMVVDTIQGSFRPPGRPPGWGRFQAVGSLAGGRAQIGSFRIDSPASEVRAHGTVPLELGSTTAPDGLSLDVTLAPLELGDLGPLLPPALADSVRIRGELTLLTVADTLSLTMAVAADVPGRLEARARLTGPRDRPRMRARAELERWDLQAWGMSSRPLTVDGEVGADLEGAVVDSLRGSASVELDLDEGGAGSGLRLRADARSEAAGGPWRADWSWEGRGVSADGGARWTRGAIPGWSVDADMGYTRPDGDEAVLSVRSAWGRIEAEGEGLEPSSLDGRVVLRVDSARTGSDAFVGPGLLTGQLREGEMEARAELDAGGGRVVLDARGRPMEGTGRLVSGSVEGVDPAALLGDTVASRVRARLEGELTALSPLEASGTVELLQASWGSWEVRSGRATARLRGDAVEARASVLLPDSGRVAFGARMETLPGGRGVRVDSLTWSNLDVRALSAAPDTSALPTTRLSGRGRGRASSGPAGWTGTATLDVAPSRVGAATIREGRVGIDLVPGKVEADFRLESDDAGSAEGRVRTETGGGNRRVELLRLALSGLDLGSLSDGGLPATELQGILTGSLVGPSGGGGAETVSDSLRGRLSMELAPSRVAETEVDTTSVWVTLDSGTVRSEGRVAALGGMLSWEGRAVPGPRPSYELQASVVRPDPEGVGRSLFAQVGLEGEGTKLDSARAEGWLRVDSATWAGRAVESGVARVALGEGVVRLDTLALELPGAALSGGGVLPTVSGVSGGGDLRLTASLTRADLLQGLGGPQIFSVGEARAELRARGAVDDLAVEGEMAVSALLVDQLRARGVDLRGSGRRTAADGWTEGELHLTVDRARLPTAPVERVELGATLVGDGEVALEASAVIDGRRDAQLSARASRVAEVSTVLLERFSFRVDQDRWALAAPSRIEMGDEFRVDSLRLVAGAQEIRLHGGTAPRGPVRLHAALDSFEVSTVADLLGFPRLRGRVTASMDLTGTAEDPVVQAWARSQMEPRGVRPADVSLEFGYAAGEATMDGEVSLDGATGIRLEGTFPARLSLGEGGSDGPPDRPVRLLLAADSFPVPWLEPFLDPASVRELAGRLQGRVEVGGRPDAPDVEGSLALVGGSARFPALGVRFEDAGGRLRFRGREVVVDTARLRSGSGFLGVSGSVALDRLSEPRLDLTVRADRFEAVRTSELRSTVSGSVRLRGSPAMPRLEGRVDVERADIYLGELTTGSSVEPVELTEDDWEELHRVFGWTRPTGTASGPPFLETATLDLEVRLGRASWVRQRANPELALQYTGSLRVEKEAGDSLQLVGTVEAVPDRSWVEQFGRRFAIAEGTLTFRGAPMATRVEVAAEYVVPSRETPGEPEAVLTLRVSGTPDDLTLELSSQPPMEASDLVAYLVTGRPASRSLGGGGGSGSISGAGGALALGRLSGAVEAYAREQVGLDVVEITTNGLDGVTLVAGRYLSPDLYLGVRQPVSLQRSSQDPGERAPTPEIEVELQAVRWLLLNMRAGGRDGVEFFVRSRLAYE